MSLLEKATHFLLIAVCGVSLVVLVKRNFIRQPAASGVQMTAVKTLGGASLDVLGVDWSKHPTNIVMAIRSGCPYCIASTPLYRQIGEIVQRRPTDMAVFAVSPDDPAVTRQFLSQAGVKVGAVHQAELGGLGVRGTPTILIVDSQGTVKTRYVGKLREEDQRALLATLSAPQESGMSE